MPLQLSGLFVIYYGVKLWAKWRSQMTSSTRPADFLFVTAYIVYIFLYLLYPLTIHSHISICGRIIIVLEQVIY
jgi:hypothetical protein